MNRIPRYVAYAALCAVLSGCVGTRTFYHQPVPGADHITPVQYAKKVAQHFNVIGVEIVAMRNDPTVSDGSKKALLEGFRQGVCSDQERDAAVKTADCRQGPSWVADATIAAYEGLASAKTEAEMQKASDELFKLLSDLINLIANSR